MGRKSRQLQPSEFQGPLLDQIRHLLSANSPTQSAILRDRSLNLKRQVGLSRPMHPNTRIASNMFRDYLLSPIHPGERVSWWRGSIYTMRVSSFPLAFDTDHHQARLFSASHRRCFSHQAARYPSSFFNRQKPNRLILGTCLLAFSPLAIIPRDHPLALHRLLASSSS
jgi:hypothetical protein